MKKGWINKGIVALIAIAIFMAPISVGINKARAQETNYDIYKNIHPRSYVKWLNSDKTIAEFEVDIVAVESDWEKVHYVNVSIIDDGLSFENNSVVLVVLENGKFVNSYDYSEYIFKYTTISTSILPLVPPTVHPPKSIPGQYVTHPTIGNLSPDKNYTAALFYKSVEDGNGGGINLFDSNEKNYYQFGKPTSFKTAKDGENIIGDLPATLKEDGKLTKSDDFLDCNLLGTGRGSFADGVIGCIASVFYMVWEVSAIIAEFAGTFLDIFVYYSTNSSSYDNVFVEQAWAAVRDIANIFFIVALLYVALKTILNLNVTDNKKLIGTVIVIALVINFSLFTTKLVIDGSNILAKVFYNNITSEDEKGEALESGSKGQKSISIGLIKNYNPQRIIDTSEEYDTSRGTFIFITLLLIGITLYTAYIFFSVGLLFVARVVSLWLAMIFSPIAFASYTVKFDIPGFGHKEWWKSLFENAFLAPLFIFFLYIIILFTGFLGSVIKEDAGIMEHLMNVFFPFVIIVMLLTKAKKLAVKFSGDMGQAIQSIGAAVGGLALGGAGLGLAAVGRGTVGKFLKGASTGDTASQRFERGESLGKWDKIKGNIGSKLKLPDIQRSVGEKLNKSQEKVESAVHARHELDTASEARFGGKKFNELTGIERNTIKQKLTKDQKGEEVFGKKFRELTEDQKGEVERRISKDIIEGKELHADKLVKDSKQKQGPITNIAQSMRTGSYDFRNLSKVTAGEYDSSINKLTKGITSAIANGLRGGLKSTLNINYGESQKNFFKDLGHTVTEAMKGAKIKVDLSHIGKEEKEHSKGGGKQDHAPAAKNDSHSGGDEHKGEHH